MRVVTSRARRLMLLGGLLGCTLLLAACNPFAFLTDPTTSQNIINALGGETRIQYTVTATGSAPIANAQFEFYGLSTGGDPTVVEDYEAVADALLTTGEDGMALLYIKASPNEPRDSVIRPETLYRVRITAAGFVERMTTEVPRASDAGVTKKSHELQPAG
jgi:hypothetical protein